MKKEDYLKKIEEELKQEIEDLDGKNESKIVTLSTILANFSLIDLMNQTINVVNNIPNNIGNVPISDDQMKDIEQLIKNKFL